MCFEKERGRGEREREREREREESTVDAKKGKLFLVHCIFYSKLCVFPPLLLFLNMKRRKLIIDTDPGIGALTEGEGSPCARKRRRFENRLASKKNTAQSRSK